MSYARPEGGICGRDPWDVSVLLPLLFLVIVAAVITLMVVLSGVIDRNYRRDLQGWAAARGWDYREDGGGDWAEFLPRGRRRRGVKFQMTGTWQGRPMTMADYWYQMVRSDGRNSYTKTYHLTVVVVQLAGSYPEVVLDSRALGSLGIGIAKAVGLAPANLTGVPEFDNRFKIESAPEDGSGLVSEQVIRVTLQADLPPWRLRGQDLIIPWKGKPDLRDLDQQLSQAANLAAQIEPDLRLRAGAGRAPPRRDREGSG
jgi:hypothetical protein